MTSDLIFGAVLRGKWSTEALYFDNRPTADRVRRVVRAWAAAGGWTGAATLRAVAAYAAVRPGRRTSVLLAECLEINAPGTTTSKSKRGGVRTPGPGKRLGRPTKAAEPLSDDVISFRPTVRQSDYLKIVAVTRLEPADVVRTALDKWIDEQVAGVGK